MGWLQENEPRHSDQDQLFYSMEPILLFADGISSVDIDDLSKSASVVTALKAAGQSILHLLDSYNGSQPSQEFITNDTDIPITGWTT